MCIRDRSVSLDYPPDPFKNSFPAQPPEGEIKLEQLPILIVEYDLFTVRIDADIAAAAEQVHKAIDIFREIGKDLRQQSEFSPRIVQGRGNHLPAAGAHA